MTRLACCTRVLIAVALLLPLTACRMTGEQGMDTRPTFLSCTGPDSLPPPDTLQVGSAGGLLQVGDSYFFIPPNAVPGNTTRTYIMSPISPPRVGVEITSSSPAKFAHNLTATLSIGLSGCTPSEVGDTLQWSIWLMESATSQQGRPLSTLRPHGRMQTQRDSTSSYMIAN
jgi:hypothetical protein